MKDGSQSLPSWAEVRARLFQVDPKFFELEPGGALGLSLADEDWMLEVTPDGRLICQTGLDMEDIMSLVSDGTPEDLGTDELAKQAKYFLQPAVLRYKKTLIAAGFEEQTEMTNEFVAVTFQHPVDFSDLAEVERTVLWCKEQIKSKERGGAVGRRQ